MPRTNVVLNDKLLDKAKSLTGIKTTRGLLDFALLELVRHKRQKKILELRGQIDWEGNLDSSRKSRSF